MATLYAGYSATMTTMSFSRSLAFAAVASIATFAGPIAALADPPAVGAPIIPGPFIGAPTTQNQYGGEETVNFSGDGHFEGVGRAHEHYANFDVSPRRYKPQASNRKRLSRADRAITNDEFTSFDQQLQSIAKKKS